MSKYIKAIQNVINKFEYQRKQQRISLWDSDQFLHIGHENWKLFKLRLLTAIREQDKASKTIKGRKKK